MIEAGSAIRFPEDDIMTTVASYTPVVGGSLQPVPGQADENRKSCSRERTAVIRANFLIIDDD